MFCFWKNSETRQTLKTEKKLGKRFVWKKTRQTEKKTRQTEKTRQTFCLQQTLLFLV